MLIFPTGAKKHNWYGAEDGEKIGHQAMSEEDLQGFVEVGEVELEEGLPEEEIIEVSDEGSIEDTVEEIIDENSEEFDEEMEEDEETESETIEEKVEDIKEDLDELVEIVVTEGEDGALEIADEEPLETVTVPMTEPEEENEVEELEDFDEEDEEDEEECGEVPAMASAEEGMVVADVEGRWVKTANLSPENQKKVREYWLALGFPQDYVDAMVKDYE